MASGDVPKAADGQPLEGGDIMTLETYENFELVFEWKVAPGANSGIKYNVSEAMSTASPPFYAALGFEYQILDDDLHPDAQNGPNRTAGALYDVQEPGPGKRLKPVGEFNEGRIVSSAGLDIQISERRQSRRVRSGQRGFQSALSQEQIRADPGFCRQEERPHRAAGSQRRRVVSQYPYS